MTSRFLFHRVAATWPWLLVVSTVLALSAAAPAAAPKGAQVTQIIKDVKLLPPQAAPRPASVSESIGSGTGLRTGADSRAELTFTDLTITRLGANTVFSFNEGARELNLDSGAILVQVPKGGPSAQISTAGFTCAVTGGTALCETSKGAPSKVMILEGSGHFCIRGGGCVDIPPGEMVVMTPDGRCSQPFEFNVAQVMETSLLITDFPPLPNAYLITQVIVQQTAPAAGPGSTPPGGGTIDAVSQRFATGTPPPLPAGTPNEFGPPQTITSPNPYIISNGTAIRTDPAITTNGITDLGKIYRGQAVDGPFSRFAFGSTSAFDTLSGFDADIGSGSGGGNGMGAGFKFTALQITGDPTVSTLNGQINLGLIAVNSITSSGPGGVLTFAGIRGLLLATENGPITLGPEISFSGLHDVHFYARGIGSDLTLGSAVSTTSNIRLYAQGNIRVDGNESTDSFSAFSGGDFLLGSGAVTAVSVDIQSLGSINTSADSFPDVPGGSISFNAAGTLTIAVTGGTFGRNSLTMQGSTITIMSDIPVTLDLSGATVAITAGSGGLNIFNVDLIYQDLIMQSAGAITLDSVTFGAGHFNALISAGTSFFASGNVNAATLSAGTTVDVLGQLFVEDTLTSGGNINVGTLLQALTINAPNGVLTVGMGIYPVVISTSEAALQHTFNVASIVSPVGIDFDGNQFGLVNGVSPGGRLTINANTITFDPSIGIGPTNFSGSDSGGTVNGGDGGILVVNTTGDINATNSDIMATTGINAPPGSPAGPFGGAGGTVTLNSSGGTVTVSDTIEVSSDSTTTQRQSASGGRINISSGKASGVAINVTNSGQLLALLNNAAPGPGGAITVQATGASSQANVSGTVTANRGTIDIRHMGGSGQINISGATMLADIIKIGALGTNGTLNIGGGMLSADSLLRLYAPSSNGTLNFVSNVTLSSGTAMDLAANTITIQPAVLVTIAGSGGAANIYTNNANYSGFGGSNPSNGTFGGNGANAPQPLSAAPPLGPAPHVSSAARSGRNH